MNPAPIRQRLLAFGYRLVTGRPMTADTQRLSYAFVGLAATLAVAKALAMFSSILAGNVLGAAGYGQLALILAIGNFWCLPFFTCWGLAYVKFASESSTPEATRRTLRAALTAAGLTMALALPFLLLFQAPLGRLARVPPGLWAWGCGFGVLMGGYYFAKCAFQGRQDWRGYAACELLFAASLTLGVVLLYCVRSPHAFGLMVGVFVLAHVVGAVPAQRTCSTAWANAGSREEFRRLGLYGLGLLLSFGISLLSMQLDRLLLNGYAGPEAVGRYQAYYTATFSVVNSLSIILNNYLLPLYGKFSKDKLRTALFRFLVAAAVPVWGGCLVTGRLAFLVFGRSFCFAWGELAWAATFTLVNFWLQVLVFFSMTLGGRALVCNGGAYVAFIVVQVITMPLLIPRSGVAGAFQGMTAASAAGFAVVLITVLMLLRNRSDGTDET